MKLRHVFFVCANIWLAASVVSTGWFSAFGVVLGTLYFACYLLLRVGERG